MRVVVAGGGIAGAGVALGLVRRGVAVTVVDAAHPGRATAAGAGILEPWGSAATGAFYELYARGAAFYPALVAALDDLGITDLGYRQTGALVVSTKDSDISGVVARLDLRRAGSPEMGEVAALTSAELCVRFPPLRADLHGVWISGAARVDGRLLCAGMLAAVERLGGDVRRGAVVVEPDGDSARVRLDGELLDTDAVVLAGGAWTAALAEPLHAAVDVEPQRGQIVHLQLDGADTASWPVIVPVNDHYIVPFDGGRVVVGATRETGSGFESRVTAAGQRRVLDDALALAPGLCEATLVETRVGLRPLAPGGMPSLGALEGFTSVFVATGYGAAGLTIAPAAGDALAELVVTGEAPFHLPGVQLTRRS